METTAGRKEWIGLAVLVLPCLLVSMDVSVLFFGLPFISADLGPSASQQLWIMDTYGFVLAGLLITMGAVGDRIGRRKLLLIGAAAFGAASVAAAYANTAEMLILARGVLGLAGATLMPSTLALVRNMFHDAAQRKTAIAVWTAGLTLGATIGPIVGGFLLDHFWWGSVFLINVPAMILLLIAGPLLLPEFRAPESGRFDLPGAGLSLVAMITLIYGIKRAAIDGVDGLALAALALGLALAVAFVHRQRTTAYPLVDISLFRNRTFSASVLISVVSMFCFIGITLYTNQYLQLVLGMRPFTAALWSLAVMPGVMIVMTVSGVLANKVKVSVLVLSGLVILTAAFVILTFVRADSPLWLILVGAGLVASGVLVTTSLLADLILTAAPPERAGTASAVSETGSELGAALGMAILGSIGAAIYHNEMAAPVASLPTDAARIARDTLGGAVSLGDPAVIQAARVAFTHGFTVTAVVGAIVVALTSVLAYRALRHVPVTAKETVTA
ncbi:integral membrane efflux protein [Alloactinosynnema sp. L-07]|uniref:MFS transporter n=1 Tax=Alloactinosynnema sp. L-07 TaxID=1653480 RepID=UPI00065EF776|nr:MFS transporter [Alloactinosynnema sp. L-07]CRK59851.1 integral membrane efflux protein [Alloactinosynnema sp. L-07]